MLRAVYNMVLLQCIVIWSHFLCVVFMVLAKEAMKAKIEKIIRREFSIEIQKKEEEILLINQVFWHVNSPHF